MPTVRRTRADVDLSKVDWARLEATTDAEIDAQIAADPDTAPVFTARELARARLVVPVPDADDVRKIRRRLGLSQAAFAARFGFTVETVRPYEQGPRPPSGPHPAFRPAVSHHPR